MRFVTLKSCILVFLGGIEFLSHKITYKRAIEIYNREIELRKMQSEGKQLPSSRRQKKYEIMRKRTDGFLWKLKDRIKQTGGTLPEHLKEGG